MSVSFGVAALGAFVAVILTGLLVSRSTRTPRVDLAALLCASAGLTAALVAQAAGYHGGFGAITFRAIQIGAQLLAPLGLVWALAEMAGRSLGARFVARLGLAALGVVAGVILAIDPLGGTAFSMDWPRASVYYQTPAHAVLYLIAAVTALAAVLALVISGVRARRDPGWREIFGMVVPIAVAALATIGLQVKLPAQPAYAAICIIAAVLTWFAGKRASELPLDELQAGAESAWDGRESGYGPMGYNTGYDLYNDDTGGFRRGDTDFSGWYRAGDGGAGGEGADTGYDPYAGPDTGFGRGGYEPSAANGRGAFETGDVLPAVEAYAPQAAESAAEPEDTSRLYGQIAIYTLLEEQVDEFDRLAADVLENVKAHEPDTLIYVMHGVPSAPMQRILYEVYRDEAAFEEHNRQAYVQQFVDERKPFVLATNVIQLGVRHAMFAPGTGALPTARPTARPTAPPGPRALPAPAAAGLPRPGAPSAGPPSAAGAAPRLGLPPAGPPPAAGVSPRSGSPSDRPGAAPASPAYPGGASGSSYRGVESGGSHQGGPSRGSYQHGAPGGSYQRGPSAGGSSQRGPSAGGSSQGGSAGGSSQGGSSGGSSQRGSSGGSSQRGPSGGSYQGGSPGGSSQGGPSGGSYQDDAPGGSYQRGSPGGSPGDSYPGGSPGGSYPGGSSGDSYPGGLSGMRYSRSRARSAYPGGSSYPDDSPAGSNRPAASTGGPPPSGSPPGAPPWHDKPPAGTRRPSGDDDEEPRDGSQWPPTRR